jgi:hypothetical protein
MDFPSSKRKRNANSPESLISLQRWIRRAQKSSAKNTRSSENYFSVGRTATRGIKILIEGFFRLQYLIANRLSPKMARLAGV